MPLKLLLTGDVPQVDGPLDVARDFEADCGYRVFMGEVYDGSTRVLDLARVEHKSRFAAAAAKRPETVLILAALDALATRCLREMRVGPPAFSVTRNWRIVSADDVRRAHKLVCHSDFAMLRLSGVDAATSDKLVGRIPVARQMPWAGASPARRTPYSAGRVRATGGPRAALALTPLTPLERLGGAALKNMK
jgi:hypothetical protein